MSCSEWLPISRLRCVHCNAAVGDPRDGLLDSELHSKFHVYCPACAGLNMFLATVFSEEHARKRGFNDPDTFLRYELCPVCGELTPNPMCNEHWQMVPLKRRQAFWKTSDRDNVLAEMAADVQQQLLDAGEVVTYTFKMEV